MLLPYAEVSDIEFERHAGTGPTTQRTFDMAISMRNGATHQFHSIPKAEFQNLVSFLEAKKIKIVNVDAQVSLFGYLVIWLFGYLVIWLFGYLVIWQLD
jgi:structure-specific recognition protein 1